MTNASAGPATRPRQSSESQRHGRGDRPGGDDLFTVLIRLPAISPSDGGAADGPAAPTLHVVARDTVDESSAPATPTADKVVDKAADTSRPAFSAPLATPTEKPNASWSQFQGLRLIGQLATTALMIGLFVAAYLLIVGGRNVTPPASPDNQATDSPATSDKSQPAGEAADTPADASSATSKAADASTETTSSAAASPDDTKAESVPADAASSTAASAPPATTTPAPSLYDRAGALPKADVPARGRQLPVEPLATPKPGDTTLPPSGDAPAGNAVTERPEPALGLDAPRQDSGDTGRSAYPVTDPATFKYPANYHERIKAGSAARPSSNSTSGTGGNSGGQWSPGTARLQPRIEAPQIR